MTQDPPAGAAEARALYEQALAAFAAELREFRIACSAPSLREMAKRGKGLSTTNLSEVLNGERLPQMDVTVELIRVLDEYAAVNSAQSDQHLSHWRKRWQEVKLLQQRADTLARRARAIATRTAEQIIAEANEQAAQIRAQSLVQAREEAAAQAAADAERTRVEAERLLANANAQAERLLEEARVSAEAATSRAVAHERDVAEQAASASAATQKMIAMAQAEAQRIRAEATQIKAEGEILKTLRSAPAPRGLPAQANAQDRQRMEEVEASGGDGRRGISLRSNTKRLEALRQAALDIAANQLPEIVRRLRDADNFDPGATVDPIPVDGNDLIGQVARAFDEVHQQAVRLASEQALLRSNVNSMFVNLSRRSQSLVQRQLRLIDELENSEQDPDQLANLFKLDHLATRMRRNGENLLVLAGEEPGRKWSQAVRLLDVMRAGASEVEQYERVALRDLPDVNVLGRVVNDLVHLVAELLENATSFSDPKTKVSVTANMLNTGGVMLEIEDAGIGMTPEELDDANERLANPPVIDVAISRRMGLYVVGRLATRHGIQVRLRRSAGGGITALVLVTSTLLAGAEGRLHQEGDRSLAEPLAQAQRGAEAAHGKATGVAEPGSTDSAVRIAALAAAIARAGDQARSVEEVAQHAAAAIRTAFSASDGKNAVVLVRIFQTMVWESLTPQLRAYAQARMPADAPPQGTRCVVLLATLGDRPSWCDRHASRNHQALPLMGADVIRRVPLVLTVFDHLVGAQRNPQTDSEGRAARVAVHLVSHAVASPLVPDQWLINEHGVQSALGLGGILPSGEAFTAVLYSRTRIDEPMAHRFGAVAEAMRGAMAPFVHLPPFGTPRQ